MPIQQRQTEATVGIRPALAFVERLRTRKDSSRVLVIPLARIAEQATPPRVATVAASLIQLDGPAPIPRHAVPVLVNATEPRAPSSVSAVATPRRKKSAAGNVVLFPPAPVVQTLPQPRTSVASPPSQASADLQDDGSRKILVDSASCSVHATQDRARRGFSAGAPAVAVLQLRPHDSVAADFAPLCGGVAPRAPQPSTNASAIAARTLEQLEVPSGVVN